MNDSVVVDAVPTGTQADVAPVAVIAGAGDDVVHAVGVILELFGGPGDDALYGSSRQQEEIQGGSGDDRLVSGQNTSFLQGGAGNDLFTCGPGRNWVFSPARDEFIPASCEFVSSAFGDISPYPRLLKHRLLWFRGGVCPTDDDEEAPAQHCSGHLRVIERRGRHRLLARGELGGATSLPFKARLTAVGRRLTSRSRGVPATVSLRAESTPVIGLVRSAWSIRLRLPTH
jgi:Ca2+-binding RTX toxin-like protein